MRRKTYIICNKCRQKREPVRPHAQWCAECWERIENTRVEPKKDIFGHFKSRADGRID